MQDENNQNVNFSSQTAADASIPDAPVACMTIHADLSEIQGTCMYPAKSVVRNSPPEGIPAPTSEDAPTLSGSSIF